MASALCAFAQVALNTNALIYSTDEGLTTSDTTALFTIRDIVITGNARTKEATILRELSFQQNERYPLSKMVEKFAEAKKQLMNTGLFRSVVVSLNSMQGFDAIVSIDVNERWYMYPIPFVKMVDRNFNDWMDKDMSLNRVNYGLKLTHNNTTGRNDKLYLYLVNGFTKQVALRYDNLFLDKQMKWSTNLSVALGQNHEVNYNTINNKLVAYKSNNDFVHTFFRTSMEVTYRPAIKTRHIFGIAYNHEDVADTLFQLNPKYASQKRVVRYPELSYTLKHYDVDFIPYPTRGVATEVSLLKRGFTHDLNLWQLGAKASAYVPLSDKYIFNLRLAGMLKLPLKQDYINKQFLGYRDLYMQGFEANVIDGVAGGYGKISLARELLNRVVHVPSKRVERLNNLPIEVYAKIYGNVGYVYDPQPGFNRLNNTWLYSAGVGLDFVVLTNFVFKVEYSLNQLGQKGLYLHRRDHF